MKKLLLIMALMMPIWALQGHAKRKPAKPQTVYMFGFCASFTDSTVYFTQVQKVDSCYLQKKTHFLIGRHEFSDQLKNYMKEIGFSNPTCMVSFATKKVVAEQKYSKLLKKYKKQAGMFIIKNLSDTEFAFHSLEVPDEQKMEAPKKMPKQKKDKKKKGKKLPNDKMKFGNAMTPPPGGGGPH